MTVDGDQQNKWILYSEKHKRSISGDNPTDTEKKDMYKDLEDCLKQAVLSENLIVLTGAGASISATAGAGGKSMNELWTLVKDKIDEEEADAFDQIKALVSYPSNQKDLEVLLSRLQSVKVAKEINNEDVTILDNAILKIEKIIEEACTFDIPLDLPHTEFLRKLLKARQKTAPRLKVFTLNYDTCFEQAADKVNAVLIDGFSFNQNGKFKSTNFDLDIVYREQSRIHNEENFFNKVLHLYKIHGSIDWMKPDPSTGEISKKKSGTAGNSLLIYPNSSKFENSYQMPFFEMISRFQIALRTKNTTLFIIGYGFNDGHINRIINEALRTNINLKIIVVNNSIKETDPACPFREVLFQVVERGNTGLILIADTFASFTMHLPAVPFPDKEEERDSQFNSFMR